jgi:hypothetical protein
MSARADQPIRLVHYAGPSAFSPGAGWSFVYGQGARGALAQLPGQPQLFPTRPAAVAAAENVGLSVDDAGQVSMGNPRPRRRKNPGYQVLVAAQDPVSGARRTVPLLLGLDRGDTPESGLPGPAFREIERRGLVPLEVVSYAPLHPMGSRNPAGLAYRVTFTIYGRRPVVMKLDAANLSIAQAKAAAYGREHFSGTNWTVSDLRQIAGNPRRRNPGRVAGAGSRERAIFAVFRTKAGKYTAAQLQRRAEVVRAITSGATLVSQHATWQATAAALARAENEDAGGRLAAIHGMTEDALQLLKNPASDLRQIAGNPGDPHYVVTQSRSRYGKMGIKRIDSPAESAAVIAGADLPVGVFGEYKAAERYIGKQRGAVLGAVAGSMRRLLDLGTKRNPDLIARYIARLARTTPLKHPGSGAWILVDGQDTVAGPFKSEDDAIAERDEARQVAGGGWRVPVGWTQWEAAPADAGKRRRNDRPAAAAWIVRRRGHEIHAHRIPGHRGLWFVELWRGRPGGRQAAAGQVYAAGRLYEAQVAGYNMLALSLAGKPIPPADAAAAALSPGANPRPRRRRPAAGTLPMVDGIGTAHKGARVYQVIVERADGKRHVFNMPDYTGTGKAAARGAWHDVELEYELGDIPSPPARVVSTTLLGIASGKNPTVDGLRASRVPPPAAGNPAGPGEIAAARAIAAARRDPSHDRITEIYKHVDRIEATKGAGHHVSGRYYHDFGEGGGRRPRQLGIPAGSRVTAPGGDTVTVQRRALLIAGDSDLWFLQRV